MTIKSILCVVDGAPSELGALNTAFLIGKAHEAHIHALHSALDPAGYAGFFTESLTGNGTIIDAIKEENEARLRKARQQVILLSNSLQVPLATSTLNINPSYVCFLQHTGPADAIVAREGRMHDLIVLGQAESARQDFITPALFNTGTPVLLVPPRSAKLKKWQPKTVALAWNGSQQAARALHDALPLLKDTKKFYVLLAYGHGEALDLKQEDELLHYLRVHGMRPEIVSVDAKHQDEGKALLAKAEKLKADMLIMGAYGRSAFREMILGGVTEFMRYHTTIPVLFSH